MSQTLTSKAQPRSLAASMLWCAGTYQVQGGEERLDSQKHTLPTSIPTFANAEVGN
jgi:hypothetical protein